MTAPALDIEEGRRLLARHVEANSESFTARRLAGMALDDWLHDNAPALLSELGSLRRERDALKAGLRRVMTLCGCDGAGVRYNAMASAFVPCDVPSCKAARAALSPKGGDSDGE